MKNKEKIDKQFSPEFLADRDRLHFAMQAAGVGIWELQLETNTVSWDDRCSELYGFLKENIIPFEDVLKFIYPDDVDAVKAAVAKALSGDGDGRYDMRYRTIGANDHKLRWVHFCGQAYFDENGKPVRFGGIAQDITEYTESLNRSKRALEESEATLRSAMDLTGLATWSIDPATGKATYSERMREWLGVASSERDLEAGINALPEYDRKRVAKALRDAMKPESGGLYDLEYTIVNIKTGRKRIIRAQARTFFDLEGRPLKLMGTAQDFTPHRNIQMALEQQVQQRTEELDAANEELQATNEELQATNEELAELNESLIQSNDDLQQFAHVASHDLKEPVRKIKIYLNRIQEDGQTKLSADALFYLQRVSSAADRMFTMINGVLSYSTINSTEQNIEVIDLNLTINNIMIDLEEMIAQKKATILFQDLPIIEGASILVYQLFYNLIINSLKFGRPGVPVEIKLTSRIVETEDGISAEVVVSDNGMGFDPKHSDKIFNTFMRLHSKDKFEGTGLGLALCKKIVQRHNGTIRGTGELGKGAVFTVTLPERQLHRFI